jgi:hypothetical protein
VRGKLRKVKRARVVETLAWVFFLQCDACSLLLLTREPIKSSSESCSGSVRAGPFCLEPQLRASSKSSDALVPCSHQPKQTSASAALPPPVRVLAFVLACARAPVCVPVHARACVRSFCLRAGAGPCMSCRRRKQADERPSSTPQTRWLITGA